MASVTKRGKDSWRIDVFVGVDHLGRQIRKRKTVKAKTKKEAEKLATLFRAEILSGNYFEPEKMTLYYFTENEWFPKYASKHLSVTTQSTYKSHLYNRILPTLGHLQLHEFKPIHILNFIEKISDNNQRLDNNLGALSSSTVEYVYRILRNIFNRAVEWQIIKENPVEKIKKPKVEHKEIKVYNPDQVSQLFECLNLEPIHWRTFIKLAVISALRRGELLGLEWKHVDFENNKISVQQNLVYTKESGFVIKETKTKGSKRIVALPKSIMTELHELYDTKKSNKVSAGELWATNSNFFIFSNWNGKPFNPSSVKTWWTRFIKRNNLVYINLHALRHTSATLLINSGVHAKVISTRLGHSDIKTTMNIYGHTLQSADREAADMFEHLQKSK